MKKAWPLQRALCAHLPFRCSKEQRKYPDRMFLNANGLHNRLTEHSGGWRVVQTSLAAVLQKVQT